MSGGIEFDYRLGAVAEERTERGFPHLIDGELVNSDARANPKGKGSENGATLPVPKPARRP